MLKSIHKVCKCEGATLHLSIQHSQNPVTRVQKPSFACSQITEICSLISIQNLYPTPNVIKLVCNAFTPTPKCDTTVSDTISASAFVLASGTVWP